MKDTIAAIATAYGEGGIGIIRISGSAALSLLEKIFIPKEKMPIVSRRLTYGHVVDSGTKEVVDEVLAVYMKGPHTYTAEDVAEIHCHGSVVALGKTLALLLQCGARLAEAGEFTKRAFLNGRLDLSQAEAVIDVVKAKTEAGFDAALRQLDGGLSAAVGAIRKRLLDLLVQVTVEIDYPEEDIEALSRDALAQEVSLIGDEVEKLIATARTGRMIRDGLDVVIVGKPNVGKSSLMNALLRENRAIVTEIPGTTRDTIEEGISVKGIPVRLTDTAGIRQTADPIERMGMEKSREALGRADLILLLLDGSRVLSSEDVEICGQVDEQKTLVLRNKADLAQKLELAAIREWLPTAKVLDMSLLSGDGLPALEEEIQRRVYGGETWQKDSLLITNVRHKDLLVKTKAALADALGMLAAGEAVDFAEVDLRRAYGFLGEMIGETVTEDVLEQVFARFCLGK